MICQTGWVWLRNWLKTLTRAISMFQQAKPGSVRKENLLPRREPSSLSGIEPPMRYGYLSIAFGVVHSETIGSRAEAIEFEIVNRFEISWRCWR